MSKLSSFALALVLGGSSVAGAAPSVTYTPAPAPAKPLVEPYRMPPQHHASWELLGSARLFGRSATVDVSNSKRFDKLELTARAGSMMSINRVLITFANGKTQMIRLNQSLYAGKPIVLDLEGRHGKKIDKVTVFGSSNSYRAGFSILAV